MKSNDVTKYQHRHHPRHKNPTWMQSRSVFKSLAISMRNFLRKQLKLNWLATNKRLNATFLCRNPSKIRSIDSSHYPWDWNLLDKNLIHKMMITSEVVINVNIFFKKTQLITSDIYNNQRSTTLQPNRTFKLDDAKQYYTYMEPYMKIDQLGQSQHHIVVSIHCRYILHHWPRCFVVNSDP